MGDPNATLGSVLSAAVGPHGAELENANSEELDHVLRENHLWLPATFEERSDPSAETFTWASPDKVTQRRLSHIALPQAWAARGVQTWVQYRFGTMIKAVDHVPVVAEIRWHREDWVEAPRRRRDGRRRRPAKGSRERFMER